ncbi:MAG: hypothetical protein ACRDJ4_01765 [Actinomycetota bacterium]
MQFVVVTLILALGAGCAAERRSGDAAGPTPSEPLQLEQPRTVDGLITELKGNKLSVRAVDGRQFIFLIDQAPVSRDYLEAHLLARQRIRVTYVVRENWSVPIKIEDA